MSLATIEIPVTGMHCAACAGIIERKLAGLFGVSRAHVSLATGIASVVFDSRIITTAELGYAITGAGYFVASEPVVIGISGMHCAACAKTVQKALLDLTGILSAEVNVVLGEAMITVIPHAVSMKQIQTVINSTGFSIKESYLQTVYSEDTDAKKERIGLFTRTVLGLAVSGFLLLFMWLSGLNHHTMGLVSFIIATPFFVYLAYPIVRSAIHALLYASLNMDVMYAIGISVAYIASMLSTFMIVPGFDFIMYDTAIMLTSFLTLGRYLESRAKHRTTSAIRHLMDLTPAEASVVRDGKEERVPAGSLQPGDQIVIRPGERIPVDSVIQSGTSYVDESMVTGESVPAKKQKNDEVIGGTINGSGLLTCTVRFVGDEMLLSRIIHLVRDAESSRPSVERIADTAVRWFIPVVLTIAILASLTWYLLLGESAGFSLSVFIAVLVVACPCALGLATPTAITVGIGRGATLGILIRNGEVLEISDRISTILFDKTGTLTQGKPEVIVIHAVTGRKEDLLTLTASLEHYSEHPLGAAILRKADECHLFPSPVTNFTAIPGKGVTGEVFGSPASAGNLAMIKDAGIFIPPAMADRIASCESKGSTTVLVTQNSSLVGFLAIQDTMKPGSKEVISYLSGMGYDTGMVTGDSETVAGTIAEMTGVNRFIAGVRPEQKESEVSRLQESGDVVVFVGDGINDSPALAKADIGIALASGTDIAMESADIVLLNDSLVHVVAAIELAKTVMRQIKLNLFWAFAYNTVLIPFAAGILYPAFGILFRPEYGALAMAFSSVTVISFSLMLLRYTPPSLARMINQPDSQKTRE
ncbi:MAG: copper-translocating P-type ATPase [Methanospirillaceae archaeon]|nr:copper-translocating P-type ATPase [Methanospirillaceae archaeon]